MKHYVYVWNKLSYVWNDMFWYETTLVYKNMCRYELIPERMKQTVAGMKWHVSIWIDTFMVWNDNSRYEIIRVGMKCQFFGMKSYHFWTGYDDIPYGMNFSHVFPWCLRLLCIVAFCVCCNRSFLRHSAPLVIVHALSDASQESPWWWCVLFVLAETKNSSKVITFWVLSTISRKNTHMWWCYHHDPNSAMVILCPFSVNVVRYWDPTC